MPTILTFLLLALTMAFAIGLRSRWPAMTAQSQRRWLIAGLILSVPCLLTLATKWDVQSRRVMDIEQWIRIVACQFVLVFYTLLRPRALTVTTAVILLPFSFSTSTAGPLTGLFRSPRTETFPIADGYVLETIAWDSDGGGNSGVDYDLSYRPAHLPGVRRGIIGTRLYSTQCDTAAVFATLRPSTHAIDVYCPPFSATDARAVLSGTHAHHLVPRGAMSPELRHVARQ